MFRILTILIFCTTIFAGELEVEGGLTVTEGVNASSFVGDGSGLTNLPSLGGEKPDRIYSYTRESGTSFNFTVPSDKTWCIIISREMSGIEVDNIFMATFHDSFWLLSNQTISIASNSNATTVFILNILEYSISGSGTEQGMDYVEP